MPQDDAYLKKNRRNTVKHRVVNQRGTNKTASDQDYQKGNSSDNFFEHMYDEWDRYLAAPNIYRVPKETIKKC